VLVAPPAGALDHDAQSSSGGVTITSGRITTAGGQSSYSDETTGTSSCYSVARKEGVPVPEGMDPGSMLVSVYCDGVFVGNRWVAPGNVVDVDAEARRLVERWVANVPVPAVAIGTSPPGTTITGFETFFWVQGYGGEPITEQLDAFGHPVEVRIEAAEVRWDFGDGREATSGGFGTAYPQRSDVTHVYEVRSTSDEAPDGTYALTVAFDLVPRYRVDGGPWEQLDAIPVQATEPLAVHEIQAVITHQ
jgi:hypothetical protein